MSLRSFFVGAAFVIGIGSASAATIGLSSANPAATARQILLANPGATSGLYWFDLDGAGGASPFQAYADMTTSGGGWLRVRHVAGSGGWINVNDNLAGTAVLNPGEATVANSALSWTIQYAAIFSMAPVQFLFKTGDSTAWGVLDSTSVFGLNSNLFNLNAKVIASSGLPVAAGGFTNVLNRGGVGDAGEDPWIGFSGNHIQNISQMMYGENGFDYGAPHNAFKNARGGIDIFVREGNTPIYVSAVPEPATWAMMLIGFAGLGVAARRRKAALA